MVKIFIKISVLVFALVGVLFVMKAVSSNSFQDSLSGLFMPPGIPMKWCSTEGKTFKWFNSEVESKYSAWTELQLLHKFCNVHMESVTNVDMTQANWTKLAESRDAEGKIAILEWDQQQQLFRVAGLPFKSSFLNVDLKK